MNFKNMTNCIMLLVLAAAAAFSQTVKFSPDSAAMADFWHINSNTSLYVGASFYYMNSDDSIIVWFESSESDAVGELYFMVPGYTDSAMYLFTNKSNGARVNITALLGVPVTPGTEIFFMYKRQGNLINRRYTGLNREGIDPVKKTAYPGALFVSREFGVRPGYGHRWAAAGRIVDNLAQATDTIVFGFEDDGIVIDPARDSLVAADFDLNDVIFKVTGLNLNIEAVPDSLALIVADSVKAGDSINCKVQVWADSAGVKTRCQRYDSLVSWKFEANAMDIVNGDSLLVKSDSTALFLPRTAYKRFYINVSLINPLKSETLTVQKPVYILPGDPSQMSIELRSDTGSSTFSLNKRVKIPRVQIPSNMNTQKLYAILRDRFGNFSSFSQNTVWDTSYSGISGTLHNVINIQSGNQAIGEGLAGKTGVGNVYACAAETLNGTTLKDSIFINTSVGYDSLRIRVIETDTLIKNNMVITTDSCVHLISEARRADTKTWEKTTVAWSSNRWANVNNQSESSDLTFCPVDTGTGYIRAEYLDYSAKISFKVNHGIPAGLLLYTDRQTAYGTDTIAPAGSKLPVMARLIDKKGIVITDADPLKIIWKMTDLTQGASANAGGYISDSSGYSTVFNPQLAGRVVRIVSSFGALTDSVVVKVVPGRPFRIVIESHADYTISLNSPDEIDTLEIADDRTSATVYALVRDSIGNYIDSLRQGSWGSSDTLVHVSAPVLPCIGNIQKNLAVDSGICRIFVSNGTFSDTAVVRLVPYHYIDIEITNRDGVPFNSLSISTNDDTTLYAKGLRSDTAIWKDVAVNWSSGGNLQTAKSCTSFSQSLFVSPVKPGNGVITASIPGSAILSDTLPGIFTRGQPVRAQFSLVTLPDRIIAGDTITAVVQIYNKDGLVPGVYCYSADSLSGPAIYQDTLKNAPGRAKGSVLCDGKTAVLNISPEVIYSIAQCFSEGNDTVKLLTYYAPYSIDSLHQFRVKLGAINASTPSFRVKPSVLNSITVSHTSQCCIDTLVMRYPKDQVLLYTVGFDKYGNLRGGESCNWSTGGTLHPFVKKDSLTRLVYSADSTVVKSDQAGFVKAVSTVNKTVIDSLYIKIIGPLANPLSAITMDLNGNGYADLIRIKFDMPVSIARTAINSRFVIVYNNITFKVDSTKVSADKKNLDIYLKEDTSGGFQTNWNPVVKLDNNDFILGGAIEKLSVTASDGMGPVISTVRKDLNGNGFTDDLITVTFSEEVYGPDGNLISLYEVPSRVFDVWLKNAAGQFSKLTSLDGIKNFNTPVSVECVCFSTSNGIELTSQNYLSLSANKTVYAVKDLAGNTPVVNNRKVMISVYGTVGNELVIGPNPGLPSAKREAPGVFHVNHNPKAIEWVGQDKAGTVIAFKLSIPEKNTRVGGRITIYDLVGNTVASDPEIDYRWMNLVKDGSFVQNQAAWGIVPSGWNADGSVYNYTIYWNGFNDEGARVAPGIYKVVVNVVTKTGGSDKVTSYRGLLGITK